MKTDYTILALNLVEHERKKQLTKHNHSRTRDREYKNGELVHAATAYALQSYDPVSVHNEQGDLLEHISPKDDLWPWHPTAFKPGNSLHNAVTAAALMLAEIERLIGEYNDNERSPHADENRVMLLEALEHMHPIHEIKDARLQPMQYTSIGLVDVSNVDDGVTHIDADLNVTHGPYGGKHKPKGCAARQYSDQMQCAECALAWDINDPDPPKCGRT